jgi:hypothetical protein
MLGMQHKADHWLKQPNLTEETVKVALTGHSVRKKMLKKLHNSWIFSKKIPDRLLPFNKNGADKEPVKRSWIFTCKLLVEGAVCNAARKLLLKNLYQQVTDIQHASCF